MIKEFKKDFKFNRQVYLKIKVLPNASKTEFKDFLYDGMIRMNIAAAPEKGKANKELIRFLSKEFRVNKKNVRIISGAGSRVKLVKIA